MQVHLILRWVEEKINIIKKIEKMVKVNMDGQSLFCPSLSLFKKVWVTLCMQGMQQRLEWVLDIADPNDKCLALVGPHVGGRK